MSLAGSLSKTNSSTGKANQTMFTNKDSKPGKLGGMMDSAKGINKNVAGTIVGTGNVVAKVAGALGGSKIAEFLMGKKEARWKPKPETPRLGGLNGFYQQFGGLNQNPTQIIDPLNTFECSFRFYPNFTSITDTTQLIRYQLDKPDYQGRQDMKQVGVINVNNVDKDRTGYENYENGIIYKVLKNTNFKDIEPKIEERRDTYFTNIDTDNDGIADEKTQTTRTYSQYKMDIEINLGIYIQNATLPNIEMEFETVQTQVGNFAIPGKIVKPSSNTFSIEILNMNTPIQENIFYPWMQETRLPYWAYSTMPFARATISFDFSEHSNIKYNFLGCFPTQIQALQPSQTPASSFTRQVTFAFDYMTVENVDNKFTNVNTNMYKYQVGGKKEGSNWAKIANSALFSAANTFKL